MRKTFATTIEENLQNDFKLKCKEENLKINEALEALMQAYIRDEINIEIKTVFSVNYKNSINKK